MCLIISKFTSLKKLSSKKNSILKEILPEDWIIKRGKEILKIINGISTSNLEFGGDGSLLYIKVSDMNNPINKPYILETESRCNLINESLTSNILERNTVVFPKRGAAIFTNKVGLIGNRGTLDPNMIAVSPKIENLDFKYLYYYLAYFRLGNICENAGLPQLNKKDLNPLKFIYPPLIQQQKIVSILENLDNLIQTTQRLIEKLQECKKGLMQRLFTEGIGHTEFKDTKLGKMPKEWDIKKLSELILLNPQYNIPEKEDYAYLPMDAIDKEKMAPNYWERRIKENLTTTKFKNGDILFAKITPSTEHGKGALIKNFSEEIGFGSTELVVLSPIEEIFSDYLFYYTKRSSFRNRAVSLMEGATGRQRVPNFFFKTQLIALPKYEEQKQIAGILSNIDELMTNSNQYIRLMEKIRKALLQVLLTGKKRVPL